MSKSKVREAPLAPACVFFGMVLGMFVPAACDPRPISTGATVSDSAGVRIVELDFGFDGPAERLSLASEPDRVIRFPEDDPALAISGIADVEVLSDGRIAVAADGENSILVFDTAGNHLDTWGGSGDGPGEFVRLDWLARRAPDSLAVGEVRVRRVSILDAGGQFARTFGTGSTLTATDRAVPPQALGLLADGTVVGAFFEQPEAVEGAVRPPVEIVAIPPAGDTVLSVGTWPGDELSLFRRDGFLEVVAPQFARRLHVATAPDGIWIADDASLEIREYSGQARLRTVVRSSANPHSVSDALLEQRIADKYRSASRGSALERLKRDQRRLAHHETMPGFGAVLGVMGGGVAVSEYLVGTPASRMWMVVDPSGEVALVDLPAGLQAKRWGQDWVVGIVRDELDREEVHRYRILDAGRESGRAGNSTAKAGPSQNL